MIWYEIISRTSPPLENVSERLQIQGSEVQDSHKAIVKDLADVRHQAQDIYHKIGNQNGRHKNLNSSHSCKSCDSDQACLWLVIPLWLIRPQYVGVSAVPGPDLTVLHWPDDQTGAHEQHPGIHAALPRYDAGPDWWKASHDPGLPWLGRWLCLSSFVIFSATKEWGKKITFPTTKD